MRAYLGRWLLAILVLLPSCHALAAVEQRIAAIVNDDVVSLQDLNDRLSLVLLTSRIPDQEQARARLAQQVLRGLIEEALQLQEAARLSIGVSGEDIDRAFADIASRNKLTVAQMQQVLSDSNINVQTLLDQIRAQIAWLKVVGQRIRPQVNVTVDQLELAVQKAHRNQGQPEYLLSEIVLPVDEPSEEERVAADAGRLLQTLTEGASFEALARQVSAASTASRGGDLGWVQASTIPDELVSTLERLRPGEVSQPLRSPVGYYIFQLRDRRLGAASPGGERAAEEVRLSQILFETDVGDESARAKTTEEAAALRARLTDCAAVNAVAAQLAAPASGDLGWLKVGDLPAVLANAVTSLAVGEISPPVEGPAGVHLLMVCERRDGDAPEAGLASQEERDRLAQQLEREQIDRLARRYLRDLRKQAYIDIRL